MYSLVKKIPNMTYLLFRCDNINYTRMTMYDRNISLRSTELFLIHTSSQLRSIYICLRITHLYMVSHTRFLNHEIILCIN